MLTNAWHDALDYVRESVYNIDIESKGVRAMTWETEQKIYDCLGAVMWTAMLFMLMAW